MLSIIDGMLRTIFRHGLFPESKNRNVFLYYIINIAFNMWFTEAIWYFYWGRFASYTTIGLIFSLTSIIRLLMTIPTGVLADMFGQKKSVVFGCGILFIGSSFIAWGGSIQWLFCGVIIQSVGRAFIAGALDALIFESLKNERNNTSYDRVVAFNTQLTIIIFALTVTLGGVLYSLHFRLPHILTTISYLIAFVSSFYLREIHITRVHVNHLKTFISQHKEGFTELWLPQMRMFIIPSLILFVLMRMYDWGISKPAIAIGFGFFANEQSILYSILAIVCALAVGQVSWLRKHIDDMSGIFMLGMIVGIGFVSSYFKLGWWGIFSMLTLETAGRMSYAWMPALVNQRIGSEYRATTLSTLEFIGRIPYIGLNYLAGIAVDQKLIGNFHMMLGMIAIFLLVGWYVLTKKKLLYNLSL